MAQYVWHPYYIDALLLRDYDEDADGIVVRYYYTQDVNFNVLSILSSTGTVLERYGYTPYGQAEVLTASFTADSDGLSDSKNDITFTGQRYDSESRLMLYRHRYYHPVLGTFCSRDPIGYEGSKWNLYEYVGGRSLVTIDPTGRAAVPLRLGVGLYELLVHLICSSMAFPAQQDYPKSVDPKTQMQHCIYNCCASRLNFFIPVGWIPSAGNDIPPFWGTDPYEDWEANIASADIGPNLFDDDSYQSCVEGCEDWMFPRDRDCGVPPKLPPYEPVDPYEATKDMCDKACQREVMSQFSGPSPEADEAYRDCQDQCMSDNGY